MCLWALAAAIRASSPHVIVFSGPRRDLANDLTETLNIGSCLRVSLEGTCQIAEMELAGLGMGDGCVPHLLAPWSVFPS